MKKITTSLACFSLISLLQAQTNTQGPSSSKPPYVLTNVAAVGSTITSIFTTGDVINSYTMAGIPDGLGAYDNNDGTFTLLMNHEITSGPSGGPGVVRAHGANGAFVSKWVINKNTLAVQSIADLIQTVKVWNPTTASYSVSTVESFYRMCSADLASQEAFYNKYTGLGTPNRIFLNGEEAGAATDQNWAHIVTGTEAGYTYELPYLGKFSCENLVASPYTGDKTLVGGMDDTSPGGQVYFYVGTKKNTGTDIDKAGLTGGNLYGVAVTVGGSPVIAETASPLNIPAGSTFSLVAIGTPSAVQSASAPAVIESMSNNVGITKFLRPEDGAWDPSNPNDFYFNTTNNVTTSGGRSRLWKLHFTNIAQLELGGTIEAVLVGTEGYEMLDNMTIDHSGHILLNEDVGNNVRLGKVWQYDIATDALTEIAAHDPNLFLATSTNSLTEDEETSGILDVSSILGAGKFLFTCQAHNALPNPMVEGGQLLLLHNPASVANAEIDVQGNAVSIAAGTASVSASNNTDFGTMQVGSSTVQKTFVIQNTGNNVLKVSNVTLVGAFAPSYTVTNAPVYPLSIAAGSVQNITISFNPSAIGTKTAYVKIINNDIDESFYDFRIQAKVQTQGGVITGTSSSQSPYVLPSISTVSLTSILTTGDVIGNYTMAGIPDGLGAYDNNDGTFTLLMNHEITSGPSGGPGAVRAHGSNGAFVSKWVINKSTLAVQTVTDLIQNVKVWDATTSTYTTYNATNPSTLAAFYRFCSADLALPEAFYNKYTGMGTQSRIFLNGEESGSPTDQNWAHIATGAEAGTSYELPYLGKFSCENLVASPFTGDKTVVGGMDDSSPLGQVYFYVGTKKNTGTDIDKAGLTGGTLYGVAVTAAGLPVIAESQTLNIPAGSQFLLLAAGAPNVIQAASVASLNTLSDNAGITKFLRPEDGAWDPSNPNDFYFNTTNDVTSNNGRSRLWRLRFTDITQPELGGKIEAVLVGTEGYEMLDNMTIDHSGHILLCEDVGNNARLGKVWQYDIATDALTELAAHDADSFLNGGVNYKTQDEETSGILDVQSILGAGKFLLTCQAHNALPNPMVEDGQLLLLHNPASVANAEIDVQGNTMSITSGATTVNSSNNTDFGTVQVGSGIVQKTYVIKNTGNSDLKISKIALFGADAANFSLNTPVSLPTTISAGGSLTITISFNSSAQGSKNAIVSIVNNDLNETFYDFVIQAKADVDTGVKELKNDNSNITLYPNPTKDEAIVKFDSVNSGIVSVKVFDIQGRLVSTIADKNLNKGAHEISISTNNLQNGNYFVQVNANGKTTTIKMVVAH